MKWGERIRMALRSFLQIDPAPRQSFTVREGLDFQGTAAQHRIWYRGDAGELGEFYHQLPDRAACRFWASVPTAGLEVRKCHTGLPREIVETLSGIITADLQDFDFPDRARGEIWDKIAKENGFPELVTQALNGCMVVGDGAFKISLDPEISGLPLLEWYDGDRVELVRRRGRVREVVFESGYPREHTLRERYGYGYVRYELFRGSAPVPLDSLEETARLQDVTFDPAVCLAVPFRIRASNKWPGRGQSFFEGKTDAFDALDEAWSQWVDAMRRARPRTYIPTSLLPRDPGTGQIKPPNPFDNQYIAAGEDMSETAKNQVVLQQAAFYAEQYAATYITALDLALQGLISPSTLGIDTKKLDNAEAQREKEKTTLYTRQLILSALTAALERLIQAALQAVDLLEGRAPRETEVGITFGEYANPSFEAVVETLSNPNTPMSIRAKVDELWGSTRDEAWKQEEVRRILQEQGLAALEEPSLGREGGGAP